MGPSDIDESFQSLFSCKLCSADGEVFEDFNTHLKSRDHLERVSHITLASLYQLHEHKILFLSLPSYVFLSNLNPKLPFFFCQAGVVQAEETSTQEEDGEARFQCF